MFVFLQHRLWRCMPECIVIKSKRSHRQFTGSNWWQAFVSLIVPSVWWKLHVVLNLLWYFKYISSFGLAFSSTVGSIALNTFHTSWVHTHAFQLGLGIPADNKMGHLLRESPNLHNPHSSNDHFKSGLRRPWQSLAASSSFYFKYNPANIYNVLVHQVSFDIQPQFSWHGFNILYADKWPKQC